MSDRIAVMNEGNVDQIGTPEEIYHAPESVFVAGFIGVANLLPRDRRVRRTARAPRSRCPAGGARRVPVASERRRRAGGPPSWSDPSASR